MDNNLDGSNQNQQEEQDNQSLDAADQTLSLTKQDLIDIINSTKQPSSGGIDVAELFKLIKGDNKDNSHQAHGISQGEMKKIKLAQSDGKTKLVKGNKVSRYEFPEYEKGFVHLSIEKPAYKPNTDIKTSKPKTIIISLTEFLRMSRTVKEKGDKINPENAFAGYNVVILHYPRKGTAEEVKEGEEKEKLTPREELQHMSETRIRQIYAATFGEEAMLSDSKNVMIDMILEKMEG